MGTTGQNRPLIWHLTVFGAVLLAPALVFVGVLIWQVTDSKRDLFEIQVRDKARIAASTVDRELAGLAAVLDALATDPALAEGDSAAFEARARSALAIAEAVIVVEDETGTILADTGSGTGAVLRVGAKPAVRPAMSPAATAIVSGRLAVDASGEHFVALERATPDAHGRALLVSLLLPVGHFSRQVERTVSTAPFVVTLIDADGVTITRSEDHGLHVGNPAPYRSLKELPGANGSLFVVDQAGQSVLAGYARADLPGWHALVTVPKAVVEAPLVRSLAALALLGAALLMLACFLGSIFASRAAGAIADLRAAAAALGRGEFVPPARTPVREVNEVGETLSAAAVGLREREAALRAGGERLRRILDNLVAFVAILDVDGNVTEINEAPLRSAGLRREEVIGKPFWQIRWWSWSPDTQSRIRRAAIRALSGETVRFDADALTRDGKMVTIDFQIGPLRNATGRIVGLIPSGTDITERRDVTAGLRLSEERLRLAVEAGQLGAWDLDLVTGRRVWSERSELIFGLSTGELQASADWGDLIHAADRERVRAEMRAAIEGTAPYQTEFRVVRPGGEIRWVASQALVLRGAKGEARRLIGVHRDITERKKREEDLRRTTDLLRIIGDTTPDPIFVKDRQARFLFANPATAKLLDRTPEDLIGRTGLEALANPSEIRTILRSDLDVMGSEVSRVVEEGVTGADGTQRTFLTTKTPMRDATGAVIGLVGVATDISDRKRAEERQRLMVRELHHRVKNSLATVQAIANTTARTATDIATFRDAFNERVISLARTHTLLAENSWGVIPLRGLLETELAPYEGVAEGGERRVSLEGPSVDLPSDLALALGMAVHELTTNAVKHGALSVPEGRLHVTWALEGADGAKRLRFVWMESDGPTVVAPRRQGFGSRLLRHTLGGQLNSEVEMNLEAAGLRFCVTIPLASHASVHSCIGVQAAE